jgi:hypothetical protein
MSIAGLCVAGEKQRTNGHTETPQHPAPPSEVQAQVQTAILCDAAHACP